MTSCTVNWYPTSADLMEEFLRASAHGSHSAREAYLAREALLGILRLSGAEQMLAIRRSVNKLVPASLRPQPVRRGKTKRLPPSHPGQSQFVFGREN